jgi:hypothetical protein
MWIKILRDIARHDAEDAAAAGVDGAAPAAVDETPRAYRSYSMPQSTAAAHEAGDSVHADYNAYLTRLAQQGDQ